MGKRWLATVAAFVAVAALARAAPVDSVRIKDITDIEGARPNHLVGFGLVVGLDNTGGRSLFTQQVAVDMLTRFNVGSRITALTLGDNVYRSGNISAVMVTAELGPFARRGSRLDVIVSVLDDATSLQGGTLLLTPLRGADGVDYVVAQGPVSLGGFLFTAPFGANQPLASVQKNHPNVGRIPGGALVEREARGEIVCNGQIRLLLRDPDYNTAHAITRAINAKFPMAALTLDAGTVNVTVPPDWCSNIVNFVSEIGLLGVTPDVPAKVVINERTGDPVRSGQQRCPGWTVRLLHGDALCQGQPAWDWRDGQTAADQWKQPWRKTPLNC
jgi:flagellar P-ring protein precursor FlgI